MTLWDLQSHLLQQGFDMRLAEAVLARLQESKHLKGLEEVPRSHLDSPNGTFRMAVRIAAEDVFRERQQIGL